MPFTLGKERWCLSIATWMGSPLMQHLVPNENEVWHSCHPIPLSLCSIFFFFVCTLMVFDDCFNGIPVPYNITSKRHQNVHLMDDDTQWLSSPIPTKLEARCLHQWLTHGIYPKWSCFVQSIYQPQDERRNHFAKRRRSKRMLRDVLLCCTPDSWLFESIGAWRSYQTSCSRVAFCTTWYLRMKELKV